MVSIRQKHHKFDAKVRIPKPLRCLHEEREFLYLRLKSNNSRAARIEAQEWENGLRAVWAGKLGHDTSALETVRQRRRAEYQRVKEGVSEGEFNVYTPGEDPVEYGIDWHLYELGEASETRELTEVEEARIAAFQDALKERQGRPLKRRDDLDLSFSELADEYMKAWKAQDGLKPTNTEQQKRATFGLFAGFWGDKPIRSLTVPKATEFFDKVQGLDPSWGRARDARELSWKSLHERFGGSEKHLSASTMNRHVAALQALWKWAEARGHCVGTNPFQGRKTRLTQGRNVRGYVAWETEELKALFNPPPKRGDLAEVMLVGLYTGMRLNEIASLRGDQVREEEGVTYIQVEDAKTPAGNRQVPLHPELGWLKTRAEKAGPKRIWTNFNLEGPGKKAGADAGREFSRFKQGKGFNSRIKAFHSFRKNVTRQMERARVPENEWAQVLGHEKGFTYGRYNPDGITLAQKAEIIARIAYPGLDLPRPS